ncbi:glycosyltransferase family 2 protein [Planotetraspora silvatica]|uniref:glycosyltransferase family 2 protein n=1 Tax=Planotetraspora silvatica TaxID=234614 RepID=UPI0019503382|nr:glycosyltransferase family A protein [Planotetraspora silvatica]
MLDDYLSIARRRGRGALPATALRTRSLASRELLAHAALGPSGSLAELLALARHEVHDPEGARPDEIVPDASALPDLARVIALQNILPSDLADALALYDLTLGLLGPDAVPPDHQALHAQLAYQLGRVSRASKLLGTYQGLSEHARGDLVLDIANPFTDKPGAGGDDWLRSFQDLFPEPRPSLADRPGESPFDRLTATVEEKVHAPERVTIVVTAFKPDIGLFTAVRSLIEQSWANLEILIVDDASPAEFDPLLHECTRLDERVRLIKMEKNGGTYAARNAALDGATGDFITFQDSDDWSHPRRIERQVGPLLDDDSLVATISDGIRVGDDLVLTSPGRQPRVMNTSSMMFRREMVRERIGYFDSVRKAADSEYLKRMETIFSPQAVLRLGSDLYALIRLSPNSLSRAEIRAGWMSPARVAYRGAYELWHHQIRDGKTDGHMPRALTSRPFPAPVTLRLSPAAGPTPERYDVVFLNDWKQFGVIQKAVLAEINTLTHHGMRVGVMQMESLRSMTAARKYVCPEIQQLINDGVVDQILLADPVETKLVVTRQPSVLQFADRSASGVRAEGVLIIADAVPYGPGGTAYQYSPQSCTEAARVLFGAEPRWCPQKRSIRAFLEAEPNVSVTAFDYPEGMDVDEWSLARNGFRSDLPVAGRRLKGDPTEKLKDHPDLLQAYPDSPNIDLRIMGGRKYTRALLGKSRVPSNWLVYENDEVDARSFMYQIDFYIHFATDMADDADQMILTALASGCVLILPKHLSDVFGNAAVYCAPEDVEKTLRHYYKAPAKFLEQSRRGRRWVRENHGQEAYTRLISSLVDQPATIGALIPSPAS